MIDKLNESLAQYGKNVEVFVNVFLIDDHHYDIKGFDKCWVVVICEKKVLWLLEDFQCHSIDSYCQANLINTTELQSTSYAHRQNFINNLNRVIGQ